MKKSVGRKDVADALQRLENVTVEETRMAAAETLKAIHNIGDKVENDVHGIHDAVKAVGESIKGMIQDVDGRVKVIGDIVTTGAR